MQDSPPGEPMAAVGSKNDDIENLLSSEFDLTPADSGASFRDLEMPLATVTMMIKAALAQQHSANDVRISRTGAVALNKCISLFVLYLADASKEVTQSRKRLTTTISDVITALRDLDFNDIA
eukprot:Selendium_serpulae@DN4945_c0_g2_i2.p1